MHKIGIDLGGTKTEGILLDEKFEIIERKRIPTNQQSGYYSILELIKNLVNGLKEKTNEETSVGICTPGALSKNTGIIKNSNTQCLIGKDVKTDLENILDQEISIENDANCFALAESKLGIAQNFDMVFGVILGTGVGGGLIINNKIHKLNNIILTLSEQIHNCTQTHRINCAPATHRKTLLQHKKKNAHVFFFCVRGNARKNKPIYDANE